MRCIKCHRSCEVSGLSLVLVVSVRSHPLPSSSQPSTSFLLRARALSLWVDRRTLEELRKNHWRKQPGTPQITKKKNSSRMWTSKPANNQSGEAASPPSSYSFGLWKEPSVTLLGWHLALLDPVTFLNRLVPLFIMWFFGLWVCQWVVVVALSFFLSLSLSVSLSSPNHSQFHIWSTWCLITWRAVFSRLHFSTSQCKNEGCGERRLGGCEICLCKSFYGLGWWCTGATFW